MNYIIDANNLAGSLGLLDQDDFDKKLIQIIQDYLGDKKKIVVLVFDSLDPLGDSIDLGNLQVIYSPRDGRYYSADDKILEIFRQWSNARGKDGEVQNYSLNIIKKIAKNNLTFVSDDLDLRNQVANIKENIQEKVRLMSNDDFIDKLDKQENKVTIKKTERGLNEDEIEQINSDLLEIWK